MSQKYWIDAFNLFYRWEATRASFTGGGDIVANIGRGLRLLARELGGRALHTTAYVDGGLRQENSRVGALGVRWCGPGGKADDMMRHDMRSMGERVSQVVVVSNDRELKYAMRGLGATCLGVDEFLGAIKPRARHKKTDKAGFDDIAREKFRTLTPTEVEAWLELFGGEPEA